MSGFISSSMELDENLINNNTNKYRVAAGTNREDNNSSGNKRKHNIKNNNNKKSVNKDGHVLKDVTNNYSITGSSGAAGRITRQSNKTILNNTNNNIINDNSYEYSKAVTINPLQTSQAKRSRSNNPSSAEDLNESYSSSSQSLNMTDLLLDDSTDIHNTSNDSPVTESADETDIQMSTQSKQSNNVPMSVQSIPNNNSNSNIITNKSFLPISNNLDSSFQYHSAIYSHFRSVECDFLPLVRYMETIQTDLSHSMRSILIDWLVEVAEEYQLNVQTLYLSVNYIDRFLSLQSVDRSKLQLLGVASMLLASKYWEVRPPLIEDMIYISDNTYNREQIIQMESLILNKLTFRLSCVTPHDFKAKFLLLRNDFDETTAILTDFIMELFLLDPLYIQHRPSIIAGSVIFLAGFNQGYKPWPHCMETCTGYKVDQLATCIRDLHNNYHKMTNPNNQNSLSQQHGGCALKAVRDKYSQEKFKKVALIQPRKLG